MFTRFLWGRISDAPSQNHQKGKTDSPLANLIKNSHTCRRCHPGHCQASSRDTVKKSACAVRESRTWPATRAGAPRAHRPVSVAVMADRSRWQRGRPWGGSERPDTDAKVT
jgi:hypothetical protein